LYIWEAPDGKIREELATREPIQEMLLEERDILVYQSEELCKGVEMVQELMDSHCSN
jgi:hypothetical protein